VVSVYISKHRANNTNYERSDIMFYETFCRLCQVHSLTPSGAAAKIGFNRASVTMWKNTGNAPKKELLIKIADFFGVTTDYLLGYDIQSSIDSLSYQIEQLKGDLCTASGNKKEELAGSLAVLEESLDDLLLAQSLGIDSEEDKKRSPHEPTLTEGEELMLKLFRQIPEDQQPIVLNMIKAALGGK
jgi:transcriptional regulator with XRE-family HTH domain